MAELRFTVEARADLFAIYQRGLRTQSPEQALLFAEAIEARCGVLLTNPRLGISLGRGMRAFTFDRLVTAIFETDGDAVVILRLVLRGADLRALVAGIRS